MIPPIFQKKNLSEIAERFKPEVNNLGQIAHTTVSEGLSHLVNIATSGDKFTSVAAKEIVELTQNGPQKTVEIVEQVSEQIGSIAKKTLETMRESDNPIVQKAAEKVEETPFINPEEVINRVKETVTDTISHLDTTRQDIEKEIIKEVVKNKVKTGLWDSIKNIFTKIKTFFVQIFNFKQKF